MSSSSASDPDSEPPATFVIAGGGIVGLVLALAIKKHLGITPEIYEKARGFAEDVGAGLGLYPNGMRVLRDIDPELLHSIRDAGYPYLYRIWERHDGTEIAKANEDFLAGGDEELYSIGIKRWRLQDALYAAISKARIPIHFRKATTNVIERDEDGLIEVQFADGTSRLTEVLFGVDGGNSRVRQVFADPEVQLSYTGVTCLMGTAKCPVQQQGLHFPSSVTSKFHAVYFPVGKNEQCFQIHFPVSEEETDKNDWGNLTSVEGKVQFEKIAENMKEDGWDKQYLDPLYRVDHAVRVGFALLNPRLDRWVYGRNRRVVLVGDAAHPPVPYVGQGAQMGIEDAGTLVLLIKALCWKEETGKLDFSKFGRATEIYERLRIPRTSSILDCSKNYGSIQERRSQRETGTFEDLLIQGEVMMDDTVAEMLPGATFNYAEDVRRALKREERKKRGIRHSSSSNLGRDQQMMKEALAQLWGGTMPFV